MDIGVPVHYFYALPEDPLRLRNLPLIDPTNWFQVKFVRIYRKIMTKFYWTEEWALLMLNIIKPSVVCVDRHAPIKGDIVGNWIFASKRAIN